MTDIDVGRSAILDLGSEDYYHLADAAVYLPTVAAERRVTVAREAMRELLTAGLVRLYFGPIGSNDVTPLPLDEALRVIEDTRAWDPDEFYPNGYCFANTDEGDAVYRAGPGQGRG